MRFSVKNLFACVLATLIAGCAHKGVHLEKSPTPPPGGPVIRSNGGVAGNPVAPGGNQPLLPANITPQEDIAWTGFDGEGIPELETLMSAPKKGPWEESETIARQTAAQEGKPILIWFTDSARSPMCKVLSNELFATEKFGKWASEHVIRLKVDANVSVEDPNISLDQKVTRQIEIGEYVRGLKKRYRILGQPSVLMLNPSGEVIARYRGYKRGDADFFWGLIKQGAASSEANYGDWKKGLEKKGYREWRGSSGRKVFAKLVSYSKGTLILIEPGGERYKTQESRLSKDDQKWIADQKTLRGIE